MEAMLSRYDVVLTPVSPTPAFEIGENMSDPLVMYLADIFTVLASLTGIPAIAIPLGNNSNSLPLSMQLMAKHFGEEELLSLSRAFLKET